MNKWLNLLASLEVTGGDDSHCRPEDVDRIANELAVKFPNGYKEFCEVFGSGILGDFISIWCPCNISSRADVREKLWLLSALKEELQEEEYRLAENIPGIGAENVRLLQKLLSSAFAFGSNPRAETYLWDLSSYNASDKSCDIYQIASDNLEEVFLVGRDFYEFVHDFCLTSKSNNWLPVEAQFYEAENITMSFQRLVTVMSRTG